MTTQSEKNSNPFLLLRLKLIVDNKPISQRALSKMMAGTVASSHICELEKGKEPSRAELIAYRNFFGVSTDYLLGLNSFSSENKDCFSSILQWLGKSKDVHEQAMFQTLCSICSSDYGLVLLFVISKYLNCDSTNSQTLFIKELDVLKSIKNNTSLSYQEIRLTINNILSNEGED